MIYNTILDAIGHTPIIRLNRMGDPDGAEILVKFEGMNVGGSIKTRTAYNMISEAEREGKLNKDSIIVEPTSGNQGIGLALVAAVRGYKARIIMPDSVSEERRKLMRHYGAEVILVHDAGNIGDCIQECIALSRKMAAEDPAVFLPKQFENPANPRAHKHHTALEIMEQVAGRYRRYHQRHRRSIESAISGHRDMGGRAGKRGYPCRRKRRNAPANGHRRRIDPRYAQSKDLFRNMYYFGRRGAPHLERIGRERGYHVRNIEWDQRRRRH